MTARGIFLNPPYGDECSGDENRRREETFIRKTFPSVIRGGVVALIIPKYIMRGELANYLCRHLDNIIVGLSPEQRFKQVIIIGRKIDPKLATNLTRRVNDVMHHVTHETPFENEIKNPFAIPVIKESTIEITKIRASSEDIQSVLSQRKHTLWENLPALFAHQLTEKPPVSG